MARNKLPDCNYSQRDAKSLPRRFCTRLLRSSSCSSKAETEPAYLLSIRSNTQVNVTKGSSTHSLGDTVFLKSQESNKRRLARNPSGVSPPTSTVISLPRLRRHPESLPRENLRRYSTALSLLQPCLLSSNTTTTQRRCYSPTPTKKEVVRSKAIASLLPLTRANEHLCSRPTSNQQSIDRGRVSNDEREVTNKNGRGRRTAEKSTRRVTKGFGDEKPGFVYSRWGHAHHRFMKRSVAFVSVAPPNSPLLFVTSVDLWIGSRSVHPVR